jgi:hypothetical protein
VQCDLLLPIPDICLGIARTFNRQARFYVDADLPLLVLGRVGRRAGNEFRLARPRNAAASFTRSGV